MAIGVQKLISSGESRNGVTINSAGTFLDFETAFNTKASYLAVNNRSALYSILINLNTTTGAADVTATSKTVTVPPGGRVVLDDEDYSNATLWCSGAETALGDYFMGKRNYSRGGA